MHAIMHTVGETVFKEVNFGYQKVQNVGGCVCVLYTGHIYTHTSPVNWTQLHQVGASPVFRTWHQTG